MEERRDPQSLIQFMFLCSFLFFFFLNTEDGLVERGVKCILFVELFSRFLFTSVCDRENRCLREVICSNKWYQSGSSWGKT